jgi:hypothetical protein
MLCVYEMIPLPTSWAFYSQRRYAIEIQKFIVPWCIAQYGLAYLKKLTLETVKEILIAICDDQGLLQGVPSAAVQAKSLRLVLMMLRGKLRTQRVRTEYILSLCNILPYSLPATAERSLPKHRDEIRSVLINLFESPIADADSQSRELLSAVLGNPDFDFAKPILSNNNCQQAPPSPGPGRFTALRVGGQGDARKGLALCPDHSASRDERTGSCHFQELLFDFLGNYSYTVYIQYVRTLRFWFCAENVVSSMEKCQCPHPSFPILTPNLMN